MSLWPRDHLIYLFSNFNFFMLKLPNPLNRKKMTPGSRGFSWSVTERRHPGSMGGAARWRCWLEGQGPHGYICYWMRYGLLLSGGWFLKYPWVSKTQNNVFITHGSSVLSWLSFCRERMVLHLRWISCLFSQLSHFITVIRFTHLIVNIFPPNSSAGLSLDYRALLSVLVCRHETV